MIRPMQTDAVPRPRLVIFDLDGVVYRGDRAVPGAPELIARLRRAGVLVRFATNNSMLSPDDFVYRLRRLGIAASAGEMVTSTTATIDYLRRHLPEVRRILAVGEDGLCVMLRGAGYEVHAAADVLTDEPDGAPLAGTYDALVAGLDLRFSFRSLAAAQAAILGGARFVATNADARYPTRHGFLPGAGSMAAAIGVAAGVEPIVIGKPQPWMFQAILETTGVAAEEALVVGDNPDADIVAAHRAGIRCALVLTGVADAATADTLAADRRPDLVVDDPRALAVLFDEWLS